MKNIHSVPVPQLYKRASKIIKAVVEEHASLKQLLYDDKNKHLNTKALTALTGEALKHNDDARGLLHDSGMAEENSRMDPWLMQVLVTELLWGKGLPGANECVPIQTVLRYEAKLKEHAAKRNITKGERVDRGTLFCYCEKFLPGGMEPELVLGCLLFYSFLMFTLPFVSFYCTKHILKEYLNVSTTANNMWSVAASVVTVNAIIFMYARKGFYEPESAVVDSSDWPSDVAPQIGGVSKRSDFNLKQD